MEIRKPDVMSSLYMSGYFDSMTGYGQQNCRLVEEFLRAGVDVSIAPSCINERPLPLPGEVKGRICQKKENTPEFLVQPPTFQAGVKTDRVWFMVWETSRLPERQLEALKACRAVITASQWNRMAILEANIDCPVYHLPLFDPHKFEYQPRIFGDKFVFGASGHLSGQSHRKNLSQVVQAFRLAFPGKKDVVLRLKIGPYDQLDIGDDQRIEITRACLTRDELLEWYAGLNVFVHPSRAEGWGFQPLQAMAVGRAVIACNFGGVAEYFNRRYGIELEYTLVPAEGMYQGYGEWANPNLDSLASSMLYAYGHPTDMEQRGQAGARKSREYSAEKIARLVLSVLKKHQIIT